MQSAARTVRARGHARGRRAVVPRSNAAKPAHPPARSARRSLEARCRSVFTTAMALLVALTSLGLARVAVIARAAEVTISADSLARRIKEQRVETDQLEVDRSSLSAPSRIEAIAADTMSMGDPASVSYITMPAAAEGSGATLAEVSGGTVPAAGRLASVVSALLDVSAGEAQSLLVGDVGLVGSR